MGTRGGVLICCFVCNITDCRQIIDRIDGKHKGVVGGITNTVQSGIHTATNAIDNQDKIDELRDAGEDAGRQKKRMKREIGMGVANTGLAGAGVVAAAEPGEVAAEAVGPGLPVWLQEFGSLLVALFDLQVLELFGHS